MSWTERNIVGGLRLHYELIDALSCYRTGESAGTFVEFRWRIDRLFYRYEHDAVIDSIEYALSSHHLSRTKRMSTLIALLLAPAALQAAYVHSVRERMLALVSVEHIELSIDGFCADVSRFTWLDRADLAIDALLSHLAWLSENHIQQAGQLFAVAAFACNRFAQHHLAVEFSYLAYQQASYTEDRYSLDFANFFVLNSNRLAKTGGEQIGDGYDQQIRKLESGNLELTQLAQLLTPLFAAFEELTTGRSVAAKVDRQLSIAKEIGHEVNPYSHNAWLIADGLQALNRGNTTKAQDCFMQLTRSAQATDIPLDRMASVLGQRLNLGVLDDSMRRCIPAKKSSWNALQRWLDHVSTTPTGQVKIYKSSQGKKPWLWRKFLKVAPKSKSLL